MLFLKIITLHNQLLPYSSWAQARLNLVILGPGLINHGLKYRPDKIGLRHERLTYVMCTDWGMTQFIELQVSNTSVKLIGRGKDIDIKTLPVFHQKPHWVIFVYLMRKQIHKQHEMYMANANQTLAYPIRIIFHWLTLGQWGLALGPWGFMLGPRGFSDTNVSATRKSHVGGIECPTQRDLRCDGI